MAFEFSDDDKPLVKKKAIGVPDLDGRTLEFESAWYLYYADLPSLGAAEAKRLHIDSLPIATQIEKDALSRAKHNVRYNRQLKNVPSSI